MNEENTRTLVPFQPSYPIDLSEEFFERYMAEPWIEMPDSFRGKLYALQVRKYELQVKDWYENTALPWYYHEMVKYREAMDVYDDQRRRWQEDKGENDKAYAKSQDELKKWRQAKDLQHSRNAELVSLMARAKTKEEKQKLKAQISNGPPKPRERFPNIGPEPTPRVKPPIPQPDGSYIVPKCVNSQLMRELQLGDAPRCPHERPTLATSRDHLSLDTQGVIRGAKVATLEEVRRLASHRLLSDGIEQPHFYFGGIPHGFRTSGASSILVIGGSGSGKTATIRNLMNELMPLPESIRSRYHCHERLEAYPATVGLYYDSEEHGKYQHDRGNVLQHWSRSFTHQAVVYNAKNEYLSILTSLGFREEEDVIILDPADPRCYAWDVASDVNDPESIRRFAAMLIPDNPKSPSQFFLDKARRLVEAVVNSFRNTAIAQGKKPDWNLRDLVLAFRTNKTLRAALVLDDDSDATIASVLDVAAAQADGAYGTATQHLDNFRLVAARWHQAEKEGRKIGLSDWLKNWPNTVLVLPQTTNEESSYKPLNRALLQHMTKLVLTHEHSKTVDSDGHTQSLKRYFFFDEVGEAGHLDSLKRLLSEGREFGAHVVLGLHQISQFHESFGKEATTTILGLCQYFALLRTQCHETADWMSKRVGSWVKRYERSTFTYGKNTNKTWSDTQTEGSSHGSSNSKAIAHSQNVGKSYSESSSPQVVTTTSTKSSSDSLTNTNTRSLNWSQNISEAHTKGGSGGQSESEATAEEYKVEEAALASQFLYLPDPEDERLIGGYYVCPSLPTYQASISTDEIFQRLPSLPEVEQQHWETEEVSKLKQWDREDLRRLGLDMSEDLPPSITRDADPEPRELRDDFQW